LIHSLAFIHGKNVKHMDIKPKNLLVGAHNAASDTYKIYIADFGIARSYKSAHDAETDSPIPFTRTYAAPEVALQDVRGFSADIFSLGCVFLEMLATLISNPARNERHNLAEIRTAASGDSSYHANLLSVNDWFHQVFGDNIQIGRVPTDLLTEIPKMLQVPPAQRPSAAELDASFTEFCCNTCDNGPEPFEVAARS
jgi:serine/threonine protein kinase